MIEPEVIIFIISVMLRLFTLGVATEDNPYKNSTIIIKHDADVFLCCPKAQIFVHENFMCREPTKNEGDNVQKQINALNKLGDEICIKEVITGKDHQSQNETRTTNLIETQTQTFCKPIDLNQRHVKSDNTSESNSAWQYYICEFALGQTTLRKITALIMLSSVLFIILTMLMFQIIMPNVNSLHKKSVFCYLSALSVAFFTLSVINLGQHFTEIPCMILGYTTYFSFLSSYCWLCVISYNIFSNLESTSNFNESRTFLLNSTFSWGLPSLMLLIMLYFQRVPWISDDYRPILGNPNYCWFNRKKYGKIVFFCTERIILISFNILMFILTIWKLHKKGFFKRSNSNTSKYGTYARIFMLMGISWAVEMLACFFSGNEIFDYLFVFISIQGYLIFILFITREESIQVLKRRYFELYGSKSEGVSTFRKAENGDTYVNVDTIRL